MHETSPTEETVELPRRTLAVAILFKNEVLTKGLEALLHSLERVESVHIWTAETLRKSLDAQECDILIIAVEQWYLLEGIQENLQCSAPRILVLGDRPFEATDDFTSLPSDGFIAMPGLSGPSLDDALNRVSTGEIPMPAHMARRLLAGNNLPAAGGGRTVRLTSREHEALTLLAGGLSNKQIARSLGISTHGAKRLVGAVLLKLGSPNRTAAVVTALKTGLV